MKSNVKLITAFAVLSTSLYATNGDHLIGIGAKSLGRVVLVSLLVTVLSQHLRILRL
jgi:hypothetical protein